MSYKHETRLPMNNELIERVANTIRHDKFDRDWCTALEVAQAVLAELAGELRDAERYRWLKDPDGEDCRHHPCVAFIGDLRDDCVMLLDEDADNQIDAARGGA